MTCHEVRAELARLSSTDLDELSPEARQHLAECVECRAILAGLELIEHPSKLYRQAPESLAGSIAERYRQNPDRQPAHREGRAATPFVRVQANAWTIGAGAAAAAAVLLVAGWLSLHAFSAGAARPSAVVAVSLVFKDPGATSVAVVGDWNAWKPDAQPMMGSDGVWRITLELPPGQDYQYQFLVNSTTWMADPSSPVKIPNGFGGVNSLLAT